MISNGLIHWGIDPDLNKVVKGIIIFLAVVINSNVTFKSNLEAQKTTNGYTTIKKYFKKFRGYKSS